MADEMFWVVFWVEQCVAVGDIMQNRPECRSAEMYRSERKATEIAKKLALCNRGDTFVVMKAESAYRTEEPRVQTLYLRWPEVEVEPPPQPVPTPPEPDPDFAEVEPPKTPPVMPF